MPIHPELIGPERTRTLAPKEALREAEQELDAARTRMALNAAAKKLQRARRG
jgi:hypothetical protein